MCGISGRILNGVVSNDEYNVMVDSLRSRGMLASGHLVYNNPGDWCILKTPGWFMNIPEYKEMDNAKLILSHVRKASAGSFLDNDCNHPHEIDGYVLVHNGTDKTLIDTARVIGIDNPTNNDSYAMLALIVDNIKRGHSIKDSIEKMYQEMDVMNGTLSIVFVDTHKGNVYWFRNQDRPMLFHASECGVIWASEYKDIKVSFETETSYGIDTFHTMSTEPDELYYMNLKEMKLINLGRLSPVLRNNQGNEVTNLREEHRWDW